MKIIPTYFHGIIDYIVAVVLLLAPSLFGFGEFGGMAVALPRFLGVLILLQALMTDYELGAMKIISMRTHLAVDYVMGILLAVSPWLFRFSNLPSRAWVPHVIVGLGILLVSAMTQTVPYGIHRPAGARI